MNEENVGLYTDYYGVDFDTWLETSRNYKALPKMFQIILDRLEFLETKGYRHGNIDHLSVKVGKAGEITLSDIENCRPIGDCGRESHHPSRFN